MLKCEYQTVAIDVWSAGVTLLSFFTRRYPFFCKQDDMTCLCEIADMCGTRPMIEAATALGKILILPSEYSKEPRDWRAFCEWLNQGTKLPVPDQGYDLLKRLLDVNPNTRITARDALRHPWFSGLSHPDIE